MKIQQILSLPKGRIFADRCSRFTTNFSRENLNSAFPTEQVVRFKQSPDSIPTREMPEPRLKLVMPMVLEQMKAKTDPEAWRAESNKAQKIDSLFVRGPVLKKKAPIYNETLKLMLKLTAEDKLEYLDSKVLSRLMLDLASGKDNPVLASSQSARRSIEDFANIFRDKYKVSPNFKTEKFLKRIEELTPQEGLLTTQDLEAAKQTALREQADRHLADLLGQVTQEVQALIDKNKGSLSSIDFLEDIIRKAIGAVPQKSTRKPFYLVDSAEMLKMIPA